MKGLLLRGMFRRPLRLATAGAVLAALACAGAWPRGRSHDGEWLRRQAELAMEPLVSQGASWGAVVVEETGAVIMRHNAAALFVPASNLKVVTTACALERLGPEHCFLTLLALEGAVRGDTAFADLVIIGGGDPSFASRYTDGGVLTAWCDSVRARGIRVITGGVLGCADYLPQGTPGVGWAWDDLAFAFSAPTSGLCFRDNAADVSLMPTRPGNPVQMTVEPVGAAGDISCTAITGEAGVVRSLRLRWPPGARGTVLSGVLPCDERAAMFSVASAEPARLAAEGLRRVLEAGGITVLGDARAGCKVARVHLASHVSPPLREIVSVVNRMSQNTWAEQLLRILGRESGDGSVEAGIAVVEETLDGLGVSRSGMRVVDGSGLSRLNLVSPSFMVGLLLRAGERAWGEDLRKSLAVAGQSGTLEDRMIGSVAEGRVLAKTGTMQGCRSLSGYATTVGGDELVFSLMVNGYPGPGAVIDRALDRFCSLLVMCDP
ncbi:D-alanyl-D-alanine carboxypeptidase/D-alanyl-D-alanine-endopeptidase [Candidatus Fermentibacteria bacterium]|nr:D-alanyl-D-alanine carboxypeptidase/D-alanyl-D-alanine-endopeptidase [Candidatus Fermentibacteria bacterium]